MKWFNYYGLIIMAVIMVPNIIFAVKNKNNFGEHFNNPIIETVEQIGRYGCFIFMVFNVPCLSLGFFFSYAHLVYLPVNAILCFIYLLFWFVYRKKTMLTKIDFIVSYSFNHISFQRNSYVAYSFNSFRYNFRYKPYLY